MWMENKYLFMQHWRILLGICYTDLIHVRHLARAISVICIGYPMSLPQMYILMIHDMDPRTATRFALHVALSKRNPYI